MDDEKTGSVYRLVHRHIASGETDLCCRFRTQHGWSGDSWAQLTLNRAEGGKGAAREVLSDATGGFVYTGLDPGKYFHQVQWKTALGKIRSCC